MSKQDTIISLLREIDKNIDNVGGGGSNVTLPKIKVYKIDITNGCLNENGYWEGAELIDISQVGDLRSFGENAKEITGLDCKDWVGTNLTDCARFLYLCEKITFVSVPNLITNKIIGDKASPMFYGCSGLVYADTSNWDTSNITNMGSWFRSCSKLEKIDATNWNVGNVTTFYRAFQNATSLKSIVGNRNINDIIEKNIGAFNGLKIPFDIWSNNLDRASLRALINGLADLTGQTAQTLSLNATLIAKLTEEDIAIATAKNWTIA